MEFTPEQRKLGIHHNNMANMNNCKTERDTGILANFTIFVSIGICNNDKI